ncbi:MAG: LPS assembly protein LptD, partial [Gammaproteobacteria bacterium]|nr:LPS assembly protein LptD [Gammaproteobacteria bacterium]
MSRRLSHHLAITTCALIALLWQYPSKAAEAEWAQCGNVLQLPPRPVFAFSPSDPQAVEMSGDVANVQEGGISKLSGNVEVQRGTRQLKSDHLEYHEAEELIDVQGNVQFWDEGTYVASERAHLDLRAETTELYANDYIFLDNHSRGEAAEAVITSKKLITVNDADYTTCNPGSNAWKLHAQELELDYAEDVGTARDVWFEISDVPVFWTPYATFPLSDKRKSGLLVPRVRISNSTGFDLTIPYYFNIAPNHDATLAGRLMTNRGVQLQGEYRYLTSRGGGLLAGEYLPDDKQTDGYRGAFRFQHGGSFAPRWNSNINYNWVSDSDYFTDLGTNLAIASRSFLEQTGDVNYAGNGWSGLARVQAFQTIDDTIAPENRPYKRLPQLRIAATERRRNRKFNPGGHGEFVNFDRDNGVIGQRVDLMPTLSFQQRDAAWFIAPKAGLRFTHYDLENTAPAQSNSLTRTIPTASVDAGMFFERDWSVGDRGLLQTLEPRLFYLYVPFKHQDDLPIFDTGTFDFTYAQLFAENRFTGADRVGDANQLSIALTSRLLASSTGEEYLRLNVGQIRYFRDREVTLPGTPVETSNASPLVVDLTATIARQWQFSTGIQWDIGEDRITKNNTGLRYQPDPLRVVNLSYRFAPDNFEQADTSIAWPIAKDWRFVGRFAYSLAQNKTVEAFGGIEYESCCWAFRTVIRRYLSGTQTENAFFFQLEFKGLTGTGSSTV